MVVIKIFFFQISFSTTQTSKSYFEILSFLFVCCGRNQYKVFPVLSKFKKKCRALISVK